MLANSQGQTLEEHLRAVASIAEELAKRLGLGPDLVEAARMGGLLHDVGKAMPSFQEYLKGISNFETPFHHEVSWAVLRAGGYRGAHTLNAVYWHHARPLNDKYETRDKVEDILGGLDVTEVLALCTRLGIPLDYSLPDQDASVPDLYDKKAYLGNKNAELMGVRACVIAADRFISSLGSDLSNIPMGRLSKYMGEVGKSNYTLPQGYDVERFQRQVDCVNSCLKAQTSQVNAPAGFGKTLQGVLFSLGSGKRTYWVTPRNVIAESIFTNIQRELNVLGVQRSVELFLGGERKACTDSSVEIGFSDIVVTNIDNLLKPMVSNEVADKLYLSLASDVVFDEYHEFVSSSPMFAAFIHFMRVRNRLTNMPRTLLLSATPMNLNDLWDAKGQETLILPGKGKHYPAAHVIPYEVSFVKKFMEKTPPGGVTLMNSIKNAQEVMQQHKTTVVAHSKFTKESRRLLMDFLLSKFGKGGDGVAMGVKVASAPILQAALDISFSWMQESVLSPESTLQRLGRLNRWGDLPGVHKLVLLDAQDNKEEGAARAIYNQTLRDLWLNLLEKTFKTPQMVTLQDVYMLYSQFYTTHGKDVMDWLTVLVKDGTDLLAECAPVKTDKDEKNKTGSSSKSLRTPGGSFFYTIRDASGNWLPPGNEFSWQYRDLMNAVQKATRNLSDWQKVVKELLSGGYTGFTRMSKDLKRMKKTPDATVKHWSKKADMPYPAKGMSYNGNPSPTSIQDLGMGVIGDESFDD